MSTEWGETIKPLRLAFQSGFSLPLGWAASILYVLQLSPCLSMGHIISPTLPRLLSSGDWPISVELQTQVEGQGERLGFRNTSSLLYSKFPV